MKVVFRVDASIRMGTGHLMRCLTLAEALRKHGVETQFICREHTGNLISLLQEKGMQVKVLATSENKDTSHNDSYVAWLGVTQAEDAAQTIDTLEGSMLDWLVVDHYGLDAEWEQHLRPHVGKLLVIDDLANRIHDCDLLLDQNYSVEAKQWYGRLVPPTCKVLLGPTYALLRKEFKALRECLEPRAHELKEILVFFTAGDDQGETLKAMQGLELFGEVEHVAVVVGQSNSSNDEIAKKCSELHWEYHCQVDYMPSLIARSDLVIGAGGSSNWERCALGVPALLTILAANQEPIAQELDRAGIVCNLGCNSDLQALDYTNALIALNHDHLKAMSEKALELVDANGAERVVDVLLSV